MPPYVPGVGPFFAKLMIIGEAPGKEESEAKRPFVGATGRFLDEILGALNINRSEIYITNVVKYQPPFNDITKLNLIDVDLGLSIEKLWEEEINKIHPHCILAVGDTALNATTGLDGILKWRGSILAGRDGVQKVVPTIHPAALFNRAEKGGLPFVYKELIKHDIQRAYDQSKFSSIRTPNRDLRIAGNSLDTHRFFSEYKSVEKVSCDIESINCIPVSVALSFSPSSAISVPLIKQIGEFPLTDMSRSEIADNWKMVDEQLRTKKIIGQNFKYDDFKLGRLGFNCKNVYSDTLLKAHTIFPELPGKSLGVLASLWTEEPYYKDEGKEPKIGKFNVKQFFTYNGRDAAVTLEIDESMEENLVELSEQYKIPLVGFYYNYVMRKHKFYLRMENKGFKTDLKVQAGLKERYEGLRAIVHDSIADLLGHEVNTKSYPQMYDLLYKEMRFPKRQHDPTSEDSIIALLGNHCKGKDGELKKRILTEILEERRIRDQISRYINFEPDYDSRCKTSFKITGTETARTSTNILKQPLRPRKMGLAFHTISKHGRLAKDIRSMLVPDDGYILIQGDLSQAEARIVAVLAEDYELLKAFNTIDVHRRTAALFFGLSSKLNLTEGFVPRVDELAKDGPERFTGKMFRHAGNYDMGKARAMNEFNVNAQKYEIPMAISEYRAGEYIRLFHDASPKIRGVFHKSIKDCLDTTRTLINPYGRIRQFFGRFDDELYKEGYAHIPQSTVADTTQSGALAAWDEFGGINSDVFVSENHDALVIQAPVKDWESYAKVLKKHMQREIDFNQYCSIKRDIRLTIPVDIEISMTREGKVTHYGDLYKVKV